MGSWYLVRHGETEWNRNGRIQGHSDVPLNESGRRQAKMLAKRLANCSISATYASDLSRATETARAIVGDTDMPVFTDPDLREFSYGEWEGLTLKEVEDQFPLELAERTGQGNNTFAAPGGEDTGHVLDRVRRFSAEAEKRHDPADNVLIVAHGGSIRALFVCLLGLTDDRFWSTQVDCASLSVISNQPNGRVLELWNENGHLNSAEEAGT
ncbi:MAG: histidine phosphatase family protein [Chloroflexi bacterium]|nr:histidine phosphatase family protein [Chloroflexota bacterium]